MSGRPEKHPEDGVIMREITQSRGGVADQGGERGVIETRQQLDKKSPYGSVGVAILTNRQGRAPPATEKDQRSGRYEGQDGRGKPRSWGR